MNKEKFCQHCGTKIPVDAVICTACGRQVETLNSGASTAPPPQIVINNSNSNQNVSSASASANIGGRGSRSGKKAVKRSTALFLCIIGGYLGLHKFYEGNMGMGILYACTGGLFLIGWIADIISISKKPETYYV